MAVFKPTVIDMSNAGASGCSGCDGDIHWAQSSVPGVRFETIGMLDMLSDPPAITTVSMPAMMLPAAFCTAPMPDAQWRLSARPGTSMRPSSIAA